MPSSEHTQDREPTVISEPVACFPAALGLGSLSVLGRLEEANNAGERLPFLEGKVSKLELV